MSEDPIVSRLRKLPPDLGVAPDLPQQVVRRARRRQQVRNGVVAGVTAVVLVAGGVAVGSAVLDRGAGTTTAASAPEVAQVRPESDAFSYGGHEAWAGDAVDAPAADPPYLSAPRAAPLRASAGGRACPAASPSEPGQPLAVPKPSPLDSAATALVPARPADEGLVCAYDSAGALSGTLRLTAGGLERLTGQLNRLPATGLLICAPQQREAQLLRLVYAGQVHWVTAPYDPACPGASNGRFVTRAHVGASVREALRTGRWPAVPLF